VFSPEFLGIGQPLLKKGHFKNVQNGKRIARAGRKKRRFLDLYYFLMINGKKIINPYFAR
jgi:hypothetical protein